MRNFILFETLEGLDDEPHGVIVAEDVFQAAKQIGSTVDFSSFDSNKEETGEQNGSIIFLNERPRGYSTGWYLLEVPSLIARPKVMP